MVKVTLALKNLAIQSLSLEGTAKSNSYGDCIPYDNSAYFKTICFLFENYFIPIFASQFILF